MKKNTHTLDDMLKNSPTKHTQDDSLKLVATKLIT